jgi:hypothetical protein
MTKNSPAQPTFTHRVVTPIPIGGRKVVEVGTLVDGREWVNTAVLTESGYLVALSREEAREAAKKSAAKKPAEVVETSAKTAAELRVEELRRALAEAEGELLDEPVENISTVEAAAEEASAPSADQVVESAPRKRGRPPKTHNADGTPYTRKSTKAAKVARPRVVESVAEESDAYFSTSVVD